MINIGIGEKFAHFPSEEQEGGKRGISALPTLMIMSCTALSRKFNYRRQICNKLRNKHRNVRKQGKILEKHFEKSFYVPYFQRNTWKTIYH